MYIALSHLRVLGPAGLRVVPIGGEVPEAEKWTQSVLRAHLNHGLLKKIEKAVDSGFKAEKPAAPVHSEIHAAVQKYSKGNSKKNRGR